MNCKDCHNEIANRLFAQVPSATDDTGNTRLDEHLESCQSCREEVLSLRKTIELLDAWKAPEPSPYFDQKMAVLLREEQAKAPAGWLEKFREYLLFNTGRQFRPAVAGVLALVLVLGGFIGVSAFHHPAQVEASATVNDLQILDRNDQAIQQMDQLLQDDDTSGSNSTDQPAS